MQNEHIQQRPPPQGIQQRGKKESPLLNIDKAPLEGIQMNVRHKMYISIRATYLYEVSRINNYL